ncbi:MAG: hypothetical protein ABTD50_03015 [Polyangiaceae bacterium]
MGLWTVRATPIVGESRANEYWYITGSLGRFAHEDSVHVTKETMGLVGVGLAIALGLGAAALWRSKTEPPRPAEMTPSAIDRSAGQDPSFAPPARAPAADVPSRPPPVTRSALREDGGPADEATLMMQLRSAAGTDSARAIVLAEEGNRRFLDSADAPERTSILIHALAAEGRSSDARGQAEYMVNHFDDSNWVREIEAFTGAHRHRNIHLGPDGRIEY